MTRTTIWIKTPQTYTWTIYETVWQKECTEKVKLYKNSKYEYYAHIETLLAKLRDTINRNNELRGTNVKTTCDYCEKTEIARDPDGYEFG